MDRVVRITGAALASSALIGQAIGADTHRSGVEWLLEFRELLAKKNGERTKVIGFDDPFDQHCPTGTILVSSVDNDLGFIVPRFSLGDAGAPGGRTMFLGTGPDNSPEFSFFNGTCRYDITMKKFSLHTGGETEIGPAPVDRVRQEEQMAKDLKAGNRIDQRLAEPESARADSAHEPTTRPLDGGVVRMGMTFAAAPARLDFSGILFFTPWSASTFLVNVPEDLTLEARRNPDKKTYDIDVKNSVARLRFSIAKKVYADGLWVRAFGE